MFCVWICAHLKIKAATSIFILFIYTLIEGKFQESNLLTKQEAPKCFLCLKTGERSTSPISSLLLPRENFSTSGRLCYTRELLVDGHCAEVLEVLSGESFRRLQLAVKTIPVYSVTPVILQGRPHGWRRWGQPSRTMTLSGRLSESPLCCLPQRVSGFPLRMSLCPSFHRSSSYSLLYSVFVFLCYPFTLSVLSLVQGEPLFHRPPMKHKAPARWRFFPFLVLASQILAGREKMNAYRAAWCFNI